MDGGYEMEKPVFVKEEDKKTYEIVRFLKSASLRPGMYFGAKPHFDKMQAFLAGYGFGADIYGYSIIRNWSDISGDVFESLKSSGFYDMFGKINEDLSDDEKMQKFFDATFQIFAEKYPEYARSIGI